MAKFLSCYNLFCRNKENDIFFVIQKFLYVDSLSLHIDITKNRQKAQQL